MELTQGFQPPEQPIPPKPGLRNLGRRLLDKAGKLFPQEAIVHTDNFDQFLSLVRSKNGGCVEFEVELRGNKSLKQAEQVVRMHAMGENMQTIEHILRFGKQSIIPYDNSSEITNPQMNPRINAIGERCVAGTAALFKRKENDINLPVLFVDATGTKTPLQKLQEDLKRTGTIPFPIPINLSP